MSLWYWLRKDLKENRSTAEWVRFQMFSAWRTVDLKARSAGVNHGLDGDWRLVSFVMIGAYLSSKEDKVELYATRREPSDFGGSVISAEDFRSVRKEPISIEWSRRKEWSVGGGSGAGFMESFVKTGK